MLRDVLEIIDLLDAPDASGYRLAAYLHEQGSAEAGRVSVMTVQGDRGSTDFVRVVIPGERGKQAGGDAPTLGVIGRLGGSGARPAQIGFVSDGDGGAAALATAATLLRGSHRGDVLPGDVIVGTHVCPSSPTEPHDPVPFMGSPVDMATMNAHEVAPEMDAIVSIDTTKGNRIVNHRGIALSPTVKDGYVLRVREDMVSVAEIVTGQPAVTYPITIQDITPYGNGLYHVNSILQPATATTAPVVGLAITAGVAVPGSATGASHESDIAAAGRFAVETAKGFGAGKLRFHDQAEFERMVALYGSMAHLRTPGGEPARR